MDATYVQETVGRALQLGLAAVVEAHPADPVDFLAQWLRKYELNEKSRLARNAGAAEIQQQLEALRAEQKTKQQLESARQEEEALAELENLQRRRAEALEKVKRKPESEDLSAVIKSVAGSLTADAIAELAGAESASELTGRTAVAFGHVLSVPLGDHAWEAVKAALGEHGAALAEKVSAFDPAQPLSGDLSAAEGALAGFTGESAAEAVAELTPVAQQMYKFVTSVLLWAQQQAATKAAAGDGAAAEEEPADS